MIRPAGFRGVAFGLAADGDGRGEESIRRALSDRLGLPSEWAFLRQVHGAEVIRAERPGGLGDADALFTTVPMLPLAVGTADCFPIGLEGDGGVAMIHAGWRGAAAGVVANARNAMAAAGVPARRAAVGPGIGPCCFEVGPEVSVRFPGLMSKTRQGTPSIDLPAVIAAQLEGLEVWMAQDCTYCGSGFHSYRRDRTDERQVAVAWLPST